MNLNEYQDRAKDTAQYPFVGENMNYPVLGLAGEGGEVANEWKKALRDDDAVLTEERRAKMKKELGDVLWYAAMVATELDVFLEDVARDNLEKLASRKERGVISGEGSNR